MSIRRPSWSAPRYAPPAQPSHVSIEDITDRPVPASAWHRSSQQPANMQIEEPDDDAEATSVQSRLSGTTRTSGAPSATPRRPAGSAYHCSYAASSCTTSSGGSQQQQPHFTQHMMTHEDRNGVTTSTRLYRDSARRVERAAIRHGLQTPSPAGSVQQRAVEQRAERVNGQTTHKVTDYHNLNPDDERRFHDEWRRRANQQSVQHQLPSYPPTAAQPNDRAHLPAARSTVVPAPQYRHERYMPQSSQHQQYLTH